MPAHVWAVLASRTSRELRGHKQSVQTLAWSPDGRRLASGSADKTARVYDTERSLSGHESVSLRGHAEAVDHLAWDQTQTDVVATASSDRTVRIWDARSAKCAATIATSGENINVAWAPDGRTLAVGNKEDIVSFIDTKTWTISATSAQDVEINEVKWSYAGNLFFMTTGAGQVRLFDYPSMQPLHDVHAHTASCYCLEFDPCGRFFAVGGADALVGLWDMDDFAPLRTFARAESPVRSISFSYDGEMLAIGSEDSHIDVASVDTGAQALKIATDGPVNSLAWHPSKPYLAYACDARSSSGSRGGAVSLRIFGASR